MTTLLYQKKKNEKKAGVEIIFFLEGITEIIILAYFALRINFKWK